MARKDWGELQQLFLSEHAATGISPEEWCKAQGLNYNTAKRYITIAKRNANSQKAEKKTANLRIAKSEKKRAASGKKFEPHEESADVIPPPENTKRIRGSRNAPPVNAFQEQNTAALKHGGYARRLLLSDEVIEDAKALTLNDELFRLRAANLVASENIGRWKTQLEDAEPDQIKGLIEKGRAAESAMMRNTVRIESICRTLDMINMNKALLPKIAADIDYRIVAADKVIAETEKLKGEGGDQQVIVHNALPLPGQ